MSYKFTGRYRMKKEKVYESRCDGCNHKMTRKEEDNDSKLFFHSYHHYLSLCETCAERAVEAIRNLHFVTKLRRRRVSKDD